MNNQVQDTHNETPNTALTERRQKVLELYSKGYTQQQIAKEVEVSQSTVSRDLTELEELTKKQLMGLAQHAYALTLSKVLNGFEALIKAAWDLLEEKKDPRVLPILAMLYEKLLEHIAKCSDFGHRASLKVKYPKDESEFYEKIDAPSMFDVDLGSDDESEMKDKNEGKGITGKSIKSLAGSVTNRIRGDKQ